MTTLYIFDRHSYGMWTLNTCLYYANSASESVSNNLIDIGLALACNLYAGLPLWQENIYFYFSGKHNNVLR